MFSIFLGADVSALVPFCPAQFNDTHCLHWYDYFFELILMMMSSVRPSVCLSLCILALRVGVHG